MKTAIDFELIELSYNKSRCYMINIFNVDFLPILQNFCEEKLSLQKECYIRYDDGVRILDYCKENNCNEHKYASYMLGSDIVKDNGFGTAIINIDAYMNGQEHGRKYNLIEITSHLL